MTDEQHLWACALAVEKRFGDHAPLHVAERIGELALAGDAEGVAMWQAIAARLDRLRQGGLPGGGRTCLACCKLTVDLVAMAASVSLLPGTTPLFPPFERPACLGRQPRSGFALAFRSVTAARGPSCRRHRGWSPSN